MLLAVVVMAGAANAQFRFGIKAGANFNKIHIKDYDKNLQPDNSCGFNVGVMTEFTVPIVGLCLDASLMYSRMNNATNDNLQIKEVKKNEEKYGKNFLEIPINIKYKFQVPVVASIFKPYLFTGPNFAFKLDKSMRDKTFQAAWNVGLGFEFFRHLQVQGSYGFGINNVLKDVEVPGTTLHSDKLKANNNYWTVSAAWLF